MPTAFEQERIAEIDFWIIAGLDRAYQSRAVPCTILETIGDVGANNDKIPDSQDDMQETKYAHL